MSSAVSASPAVPARYRFVALVVVWSAYLVVFLSRLCVGPLAPFLKEDFGLNNAQVGALTSATALAYAPTLVLAGWLADRIGTRPALLIGTLITGAAVGAVSLAPSYGAMLLLLVVSGLGCGFIYPTAVKAIMLWFPAHERATAVGVNQSAVNVSGVLGAAIMPALALAFGWRSGFVAASAVSFAVCIVAFLLYRDPRADERPYVDESPQVVAGPHIDGDPHVEERDPGRAADRPRLGQDGIVELEQGLPLVTGDGRLDRAALKPGFLAVLRSRDILLLGLAALFLCMVEFSALAHLVLFLKVDWKYTAVAAGGLLAVSQAAGAVGKPLSGLLSDRLLGRRRKAPLIVLAGLAACACGILAYVRPGQTWALWAALLLMGVGAVGWGGLFGALAGEIAGPAAAGAAAGVTAAIDNIGIFAGPPLFGWIVDTAGSYAPAWWTMLVAALLAALLLAFVRERR